MNPLLKRFHVALVLAVVLALLFLQVPNAYSAELAAPEQALTFLTDVVGLDMTKYKATLDFYQSYPADAGGVAMAEANYILESAGSKLEVSCKFRNDALVYCYLYGSPLFAQPSTNILDAAKGLIQRYQTYSGASYLREMRNILDTVTEIKPMTTTSGNVKLEISTVGLFTYINWIYTVNGLDVDWNAIHLGFRNGSFEYFKDSWNLYKVGSTDINVSEEEAIRIAREYAYSHPYTFGGVPVNFTILDEPVSAELSMQPRGNYTVYPWWDIRLYLDKLYPGKVSSIQVTLWADTGEVTNCEAISGGGTPVPTEPPTEPPPDDSTGLDPTPFLIAVPIVLAIILGVVFYKKRKH